MKPYTVTAGHGGSDPGAVNTAAGVTERDLMTNLRDVVAHKMRARGLAVRTDGAKGVNDPLASAMHLIAGSQVAIELHTNSVESPLARGVEVVAPVRHKARAQAIAQAIARTLGTTTRQDGGWYEPEKHRRDRGWKNSAAFVRQGGLIVEVFFISNPVELAAYQNKFWLVAQAIADAVSSPQPHHASA